MQRSGRGAGMTDSTLSAAQLARKDCHRSVTPHGMHASAARAMTLLLLASSQYWGGSQLLAMTTPVVQHTQCSRTTQPRRSCG